LVCFVHERTRFSQRAERGEPLWTDSEKKNRLIAAFKEEQATAKPPVTADDIPFRYEDITKEWLTTILGKGVKGAEVTSFTLGVRDPCLPSMAP
jgi:hypothetical protein